VTSDDIERIRALEAQLAEVQAELDTAHQQYLQTVLDIGQILRAPARKQARLSADRLGEDALVFNRDLDWPLVKAIKREVHQLAQEKYRRVSLAQDKNPNSNPHFEELNRIFADICEDELRRAGRLPGRRNLAGLAQRVVKDLSLDANVSIYAAEKYLDSRKGSDKDSL